MSILATRDTSRVQEVVLSVDGVDLSGLLCRAREPRGLVVALHGGGARADYFHGRVHPDQSLLTLAGELGYSTIALDRPGHGASAGRVVGWPISRKADLVAAALGDLEPEAAGLRPVVVGHSFGAQLGLHLAGRPGFSAGVALFGSGTQLRDRVTSRPGATPGRVWDTVWGAPELYVDGARAAMTTSAAPTDERAEMQTWSSDFPTVAGAVPVPVHLAFGEHEGLWRTDEAALDQLARHFTSSLCVHTVVLAGAPHNVSVSRAARAYHLTVLAFAEECFVRERVATRSKGQTGSFGRACGGDPTRA